MSQSLRAEAKGLEQSGTREIPSDLLPYSELPAPGFIDYITGFRRFFRDPLASLDRLTHEHGPHTRVRFAGIDYLILRDAEASQRVLLDPDQVFIKGPNTRSLRVVLGAGLLTSEGPVWQSERKIIAPFLTPKHIRGYATAMVSRTSRFAEDLNGTFGLRPLMSKLTLEIVGDVLFGTELSTDKITRVHSAMATMLTTTERRMRSWRRFVPQQWLVGTRKDFQESNNEIDSVIDEILALHSGQTRERVDVLSRLTSAVTDDGQPLARQQVRDELVTLLFAGHETTSNLLTFAFLLLSQHPETYRRLVGEVDAATKGHPVTFEQLASLKYMDAVFKEVLRLYPTVPLLERQTTRDTALPLGDGRFTSVPKGVVVIVSPWLLQRTEQYFPEPEKFSPERWLERDKGESKQGYIPFGGGKRVCAGSHFAIMEASIVMAELLRNLDIKCLLPPSHQSGVTLRPEGDVPTLFKARA